MSAPGNSVILLALLSLFLGCAGYALGRLHERRMSGEEREEAYRDGYDHAARSVFSLAARVAGPRRRGAVRASAMVGDTGEAPPRTGEPDPSEEPPIVDASEPEPPAVAPVPPAVGPAPPAVAPVPPAVGPALPAVGPVPPVVAPAPPAVGFPAPPPHAVPGIPVPAAQGGVHYSSLRDPHWSGQTAPIPPAPPAPPAPPVAPTQPVVPVPRARHAAEPERVGRHTVPDELVQAATYKLAADRVARAKVRPPEDPADPPVPRPRGH
ncbi:hypothetical protein [Actinoplanes sp. NPDC020271]|uniref:hypothetical protein n=1 Tax=Actinoplanes sp. NPDC020271 TaxID=3363896 RepID=UPI0037B7E8EA